MQSPFVLAIPADEPSRQATQYAQISSSIGQLAACTRFHIPGLRVGNLDAMIALADELGKTDAYIESVARKVARQGVELANSTSSRSGSGAGASSSGGGAGAGAGSASTHSLAVEGGTMQGYMTEFGWNEQRYSSTAETCAFLVTKIKTDVARVEEQMKIRFAELQELKSRLSNLVRKTTGSLLMRSIDSLEAVHDNYVATAYLSTVFVAVKNSAAKEFLAVYETLVSVLDPDTMESFYAAVPRSATVIASDAEYTLYSVVVLAKLADDFKREIAALRFVVRELENPPPRTGVDLDDAPLADYDDGPATPNPIDPRDERASLEERLRGKELQLSRWCANNFSETYVGWSHLKAIRVFVEAVLRYGLPASFIAILVQPRKKNAKKLHDHLTSLFGKLTTASFDFGDDEPSATADAFHPYVAVDVCFDLP